MGIQQKLHTKLVQKLILTPSLQQAIKLLPMSTLELSDLLNQEMVENPMLEEVPTEELQPAEAAATPEKAEPEQAAKLVAKARKNVDGNISERDDMAMVAMVSTPTSVQMVKKRMSLRPKCF